jgi:hypothetical protein
MSRLEEQLEAKKIELASLETKADKAHAAANGATPGGVVGYDSAILSGIRRKPNHKKDAARFASYDREAAAVIALETCREEVQTLERRIERETRNAPVPFTAEELKAATHIRAHHGWHKVVRVNAKTVSVETGYSWMDRIKIEAIREVRTIETSPRHDPV